MVCTVDMGAPAKKARNIRGMERVPKGKRERKEVTDAAEYACSELVVGKSYI